MLMQILKVGPMSYQKSDSVSPSINPIYLKNNRAKFRLDPI